MALAALHCCRQVDVIGGIHPGTAFTEPRFYPPGWVKQFHGRSCAAREWCAALTIGSLSEDPVNGTTLNPACQGAIRGGIGYVSFVFLTRSGTPIGPPNPLQFSSATPGGRISFPAGSPDLVLPRARCTARSWRQLRPGTGCRWRRGTGGQHICLMSGCLWGCPGGGVTTGSEPASAGAAPGLGRACAR